MEKSNAVDASTPSRFASQSPPSLLIVTRAADLEAFLRGSLERWYQIAVATDGVEAAQHLEHCPPQALIVGELTARGEEALVSALEEDGAPPALKLWSKEPPAAWASQALRHPFMRVDLLRAVDRLMHARARSESTGSRDPIPNRDTAQIQNGA